MQQKLRDLLEKEGLKPSQFAEMLGVNPAGISHLLAGRNKPGYDLLQKILRRFPQINPDWLLVDRGPMYRTDAESIAREELDVPIPTNNNRTEPSPDLFAASTHSTTAPAIPTNERRTIALPQDGRRVSRVVIFYDDQTFESYSPQS